MDDSDNVDELALASKSWDRAIRTATKTGYREGVGEGSESVFQKGYDIGYVEAFKFSFLLGKYKGMATALPAEIKHPPEIEEILGMTRRGACVVCKTTEEGVQKAGSAEKENMEEKPLEEIIKDQREHSALIAKTLRDYFEPLFVKHNLNVEDLPSY